METDPNPETRLLEEAERCAIRPRDRNAINDADRVNWLGYVRKEIRRDRNNVSLLKALTDYEAHCAANGMAYQQS